MGKWTYESEGWKGRHIKVNGLGWASIDDMFRSHNADCAAYENQIADLEEERDAAVEFAHTVEREFAAANATLERLREVVPEGDSRSWSMLDAVYSILYPQQQPPETTP